MTRLEHIQALLEEYAAQRAADETAQSRRVAEADAREPRIAALRAESAQLALSAARAILEQKDAGERREISKHMRERGQAINREIRALLKAAGLPENHLEMQYRCPLCRDTGYVGEAPARFCECFESRLRLRQYEDGSMAGLDEQNFSRFDPSFIPEADGQRQQAVQARNLCEAYADSFPDTEFRNLLICGEGGLGKTFLLNCIFERVISRGCSAVRITAFRLFESMRRQAFGEGGDDGGFEALIEVPLLLIDDLGSEPMWRNVTVEYLFTLLNERSAAGRHTVVATNLTPTGLKERYGERVASRLLDRTRSAAIQLKGKDLRRL